MTDDTPKKRTPEEMMQMLVDESMSLGQFAEQSRLPVVPALMAAYKTGLRIALEIFRLDYDAGMALLAEDMRTDKSGADMAQAARETIYDIPVSYMGEDEVRADIERMRSHVDEHKAVRRPQLPPATHRWHN